MEVSHEYFKENILPHFSDLFSYRTPCSSLQRTGTDRRIQTRPGSPEKTSHFPYPARHRSGGLQTRAYKTFGKTAFKI